MKIFERLKSQFLNPFCSLWYLENISVIIVDPVFVKGMHALDFLQLVPRPPTFTFGWTFFAIRTAEKLHSGIKIGEFMYL